MTFGEKLQAQRRAKRLSQEGLADQLGVSRQAVSKWENETSAPDVENVVRLSHIFGVSTDYLLKDDWTEQPEPSQVAPPPAPRRREWPWRLAGGLCIAFSVIGYFVVWVLAKVYPAQVGTVSINGRYLVGMELFVWTHSLEDFLTLLRVFFVLGLLLLVRRPLLAQWKKLRSK